MVTKKQNKFLILIVILLSLVIINLKDVQQVNAEYLIKQGYSYTFYLETLNTPSGSNHFINYGGLFISEDINLHVKFLEVSGIIVRFRVTVGQSSSDGLNALKNLLVQENNWDELTTEYEGLGYDVVETDTSWGVRQNNSAIVNANFSKKDGVLLDFYAFNQTDFIDFLYIGELYIYRTGESYGRNWMYSFLAVIPIGGVVAGIVVYMRKIKTKEKLMEAT
ncbi:MAG: hypothetical protein FK733_06860 [Asgard group archaeon]|nr:hypothetical protein [Asgard group archaeon]